MPYDLISLIQASAGSGTAGESFLNHVTGAASLVEMDDYTLAKDASPVWGGTPLLPVDFTYASQSVFTVTASFAGMQAKYPAIRRNGTSPWSQIGTILATTGSFNSVSWDDTNKTVTASVSSSGLLDPATLPVLTSYFPWFRDYAFPTEPPDSASYAVRVTAQYTSPAPASSSTDYTWQLRFLPDLGFFNPIIDTPSYDIRIYNRSYPIWTSVYESAFYDDAGYTNSVSNTITSSQGDPSYTWYVQYRLRAEYNGGTPGSYTQYGAVVWSDPRNT